MSWKNYCHPQQRGTLHVNYNQQHHVYRLVSIYALLPWQTAQQLEQNQFRETRKYLDSFYVQQPYQSQNNNATESGEEGKAIHIHEDYRNHCYQLPTLTSDQQQQIEEDLALMTRKGVYPSEYTDSFERF